MSEKPVHSRLRRLVDWINLTGAKKVHSLIDKVYKRKNLEMAWEKVKANRGSGGVDGQSLEAFEAQLEQQLDRLHRELKDDTYQPLPVRQHPIPKRDKPGGYRMLGIPAIYDRVCAFHGPGAATNQAGVTSADQRTDCGVESALAGLGRVLQTCPGPKTLPTSRRLDPAANLVAPGPTLAQRRLETAARDQVVRRVRACPVALFNTFSCILASLSLRESCMREIRTCSLGGGRRPARKRASSDPTGPNKGFGVPEADFWPASLSVLNLRL